MKDRGIVCKFYICEGSCSKGREGTFNKYCQKCDKYFPRPGGKNTKEDRRKEKLKKILRKEKF